jgi:DNA-binding transcriptional LysR family regulator
MISIRQIRSFVAVCEEASFTAAARRERATQSGLSQHIKQLERELGTILLDRRKSQVTPTAPGSIYYRECIEVLRKLDEARQRVANQPLLGEVRVGLMPACTRSLLRPALMSFLAQAPLCNLSVFEAYSGVLTDRVVEGALDFAIVPAFEGRVGISMHLLARDREVLVRSRQLHDGHLRPIRLAEASPLKLILPAPQNTRRRNIETYLRTNGVAVAHRLELDAMMGTMQLIEQSDWAAILPFSMVVSDIDRAQYEIRPIVDPPFYSELVFIEPAQRALSPAARLFADLLKAEAADSVTVFGARLDRRTPRRRAARAKPA